MQKYFFIAFVMGLGISFLGSLPLGTLNIAAMKIGIDENYWRAIQFSLGSLLVEMIYVRVSLVGMEWFTRNEKLMQRLQWISLSVILLLAASSFYAAYTYHPQKETMSLAVGVNRFVLGVFMSAINPVQIPFWFGWSTILFEKKLIRKNPTDYNFYIVGIGLGTLLGNCIFIFGGKYAVSKINNSGAYLNWVIGSVFLATALLQLYKMLRKK